MSNHNDCNPLTKKENVINFAKGHPNPSLLPDTEMRSILKEISSEEAGNNNDPMGLDYGDEEGNGSLLTALSDFLHRHTKNDEIIPPSPSSSDTSNESINKLFVTNGVSHGIDLLCATQTNPGDVVMVERPTYYLAAGIFKSHGLNVQPLPMNKCGAGIDVDRLIATMNDNLCQIPKLIYIIPTHHNPTSRTMCLEDRRKIAEFVVNRGIILVADETYHLLDWTSSGNDEQSSPRHKSARMAAWNNVVTRNDNDVGCCVSVSSFTKIFAPGLRYGWIEGPEYITRGLVQHGYIQSGLGCAPFVGYIMEKAMTLRLVDNVLMKLRQEYSQRVAALVNVLTTNSSSPPQTQTMIQIDHIPTGGYFLWIKFPSYVHSEELLRFCMTKKYHVTFMPGTQCDVFYKDDATPTKEAKDVDTSDVGAGEELAPDAFKCYARLCFAYLDKEDLVMGANRLLRAVQDYTATLNIVVHE